MKNINKTINNEITQEQLMEAERKDELLKQNEFKANLWRGGGRMEVS